ncbi:MULTISPECIES: hypothetical protein [Bacillaceae]|uniref:hypothetical protein n=1 Tax=Bacillaceae TaxID=186817 RepID=UPI00101D0651|nr:hypothetical protein [Ectobacillus funiculus]
MIGCIIAIIVFNILAFKLNKRLTTNQVVHIWTFTIAFQCIFDFMLEFKYYGYWYFDKGADWLGLLPHTVLISPVNMMFLNGYPFEYGMRKKVVYIVVWTLGVLVYETITLLPEPWGYFHYGWWRLWHAALVDPVLFFILLKYYKWICKLERQACQ